MISTADPTLPHGLAMCCGTTPEYKFGVGISSFYVCPTCNNGDNTGGWSRNKPWVASIWNKAQHKATRSGTKFIYSPAPKLDAGENWRYTELRFTAQEPYAEKQVIYELPFVLFSTEEKPENRWLLSKDNYECIIDESRCFKQFTLRSFSGIEVPFSLPPFKKTAPFSVYVDRSWATSGNWWYTLNIYTHNPKWTHYFKDILRQVI